MAESIVPPNSQQNKDDGQGKDGNPVKVKRLDKRGGTLHTGSIESGETVSTVEPEPGTDAWKAWYEPWRLTMGEEGHFIIDRIGRRRDIEGFRSDESWYDDMVAELERKKREKLEREEQANHPTHSQTWVSGQCSYDEIMDNFDEDEQRDERTQNWINTHFTNVGDTPSPSGGSTTRS